MASNRDPGWDTVRVSRAVEWAAYEGLPPALRRYLAEETPFKWSAFQVAWLFRRKSRNVYATLVHMRAMDQTRIRQDLVRVWGLAPDAGEATRGEAISKVQSLEELGL